MHFLHYISTFGYDGGPVFFINVININTYQSPFFTTKDVGEGTGLGMSIVYSIIESHHGRIEIESAPNQGSEVMLYLPLRLKR